MYGTSPHMACSKDMVGTLFQISDGLGLCGNTFVTNLLVRNWNKSSFDLLTGMQGQSWLKVNFHLIPLYLCNDDKKVIPVSQNRGENYYGNY